MEDQCGLLVFAGVALLIAVTPGPNMVYLLSRAVGHGRRAGIVALMGVLMAFVLHVVVASSGLAALLLTTDHALQALRLVGAGCLLWQGARSLAAAAGTPIVLGCATGNQTARQHFVSGFLVNALNPVVALFFITVLPQFVSPAAERSVLVQSVALGMTYTAISVAVNLVLTLGAARVASWMRSHPRRLRGLRWAMAAALTALALRLLWQAVT